MEKKTSSNDFAITRRGLFALTGTALAGSLLGRRNALASEENQIGAVGAQPNDTLNTSVPPKPTKSEHRDVLMEPPSYKEQEESARLAGELERALSELGIEAEIENWDEGPTCITYHAVLAPDANLYDITGLNREVKSPRHSRGLLLPL